MPRIVVLCDNNVNCVSWDLGKYENGKVKYRHLCPGSIKHFHCLRPWSCWGLSVLLASLTEAGRRGGPGQGWLRQRLSASQACPGAPAAQISADSHLRAMGWGWGCLACVPRSGQGGASVRIPCEPVTGRAFSPRSSSLSRFHCHLPV